MPTLKLEKEVADGKDLVVAGVDESGRGPLAGPVVVCAVILPANFRMKGLDDSKKLTPIQRERFYQELTASGKIIWAVASRDNQAVDRLNILQATYEAMREAATSLRISPDFVLVDGLPVPQFPLPHRGVIGGDGISLSIAAASVIAKVTRDCLMQEADVQYPQYGFRDHKGYATEKHLKNLKKYGPCPLHRLTFSPLAQAELPFEV